LADAGRAKLTELPPGAWFCHRTCESIHAALAAEVAAGEWRQDGVGDGQYSLLIMCGDSASDVQDVDGDGVTATQEGLAAVERLLCESFDPIVDVTTGMDLLPLMVRAASTSSEDHSFATMHAVLLRHAGVPVCGAVFRVFDTALGELPLVATAAEARRQGHCGVLVTAVEALLRRMGVTRLALPAAHEVERVWTTAFGFAPMSEELLRRARAELRLLVFPGSRMLVKNLM
jgi:N-acetylglutamate synthase-like GNAT family acetyltransferase